MSTPLTQADLRQIVARIDAIIRELEVMRCELARSAVVPPLNLTELRISFTLRGLTYNFDTA
ncbi:MAG: hypothetical protein RML36_17005 [Anaerolineae bacterium]|nr:hypothetical protein [Anaerolineae bacterium]MDW8101174.1 hypothetical protein [Anaerolineae bacterium]